MTDRSVAVEEKRQQILNGAIRAFAKKGYHACRVGDIAEEAGVAHGLLYHYFKSKEDVLETIFRDTWGQMLERIAEVEEMPGSGREQVRRVAALVLRTWVRNPDLVRVLVRDVTRSQHIQREAAEIQAAYDRLASIIARAQESGEFRRDLDPGLAAVVFYGAMEEVLTGWVMGTLTDRPEDVARAERLVVDLVCDGVAAPPVTAAGANAGD